MVKKKIIFKNDLLLIFPPTIVSTTQELYRFTSYVLSSTPNIPLINKLDLVVAPFSVIIGAILPRLPWLDCCDEFEGLGDARWFFACRRLWQESFWRSITSVLSSKSLMKDFAWKFDICRPENKHNNNSVFNHILYCMSFVSNSNGSAKQGGWRPL